MNLSRLKTLRELANRATMAAVAQALHLTPSAISQQLAQLEEDFGVSLIERKGRRVQLTAAGLALAVHAERMLSVLDEANAELASMRNEISGEVRIAGFPSVATALLPATIRELRQRHPLLEVVFMERGADEGLDALRSWMADIALTDNFAHLPDSKEKGLQKSLLLEDELCALVPCDHRLAQQDVIHLSDLAQERWALESTSDSFAQFVVASCLRAGFEPRQNGYCKSFGAVETMVASSCSVSVIPGLLARDPSPAIAVRRLAPTLVRRISIMYPEARRRRPAVQAVVQALHRSAREIRPA